MSRYRYIVAPIRVIALGLLLSATPLPAQAPPPVGSGLNEVFVGSEIERYLRLLQSVGKSDPYPWSIRSFSPGEVTRLLPRDSAHPWSQRYPLRADSSTGPVLEWVPPRIQLFYNSAVPYGTNDGAVWAGKGVTTALQTGFAARYGPISLVLAPIVFRAENERFELASAEGSPFADPLGVSIDLPQRFGDEAYTRVDPGQSTLRVDGRWLAVGLSTANQHWGPASEYPLVLGNNAPGFPHAFVGTSGPVNVGVGRLQVRAVYGRLDQSPYSAAPDSTGRRLTSGLVAVFTPRGIPGLEVGGARFFQEKWPRGGVGFSDLLGPLESFWKKNTPDPDDTNEEVRSGDQVASVFLRWVAPRSGFEFYGEYARDDHSWDLRDFILEPDHSSGYLLGFQKVWPTDERSFVALRGEVLNTQASHLRWIRPQPVFYAGSGIPQGHTHRGQLLGAAAGPGGNGVLLASDYYHPSGRWSVEFSRTIRHGRWTGRPDLEPDVQYGAGIDGLLFRGRFDVAAGLGAARIRDPFREVEETNLHSTLQVRVGL